MIIGENREAVINNIRVSAESGDFYSKVELNDPVLTKEQSDAIVYGQMKKRQGLSFKIKTLFARSAANLLTDMLNRDTEIKGLEKIKAIKGGAIITSNHFSPTENTVIRHMTRKLGKPRLNIVSQETNFAMKGIIGFLMNYADTIPISANHRYVQNEFTNLVNSLLENNEYVLIYPEQEMWFNYRKPRPFKRGAYYFAAKAGVPIISCFVEMTDLWENDTPEFKKVKYTLHILDPIVPDPQKSAKENSIIMCNTDYEQKKKCYEKCYGKPLNYGFDASDIAGWCPKEQ